MSDDFLEAELCSAIAMAKHERAQPILEYYALGHRMQWGIAMVDPMGRHEYQPAPDGSRHWAFIVPVVRYGDLFDLCAISCATEAMRTRLGLGVALGEDEIARARDHQSILRLVRSPLTWIRDPSTACIIDWSSAFVTLNGVGKVVCDHLDLVDRIERVYARPVMPPLLAVHTDA